MIKIRAPKDFYAGLLFIAIGLLGAGMAMHYPFGSALRMGPGYLPTTLSVAVAALGVVIMLQSFVIDGEAVSRVGWVPLILVTASIVAFGLLITQFGLVIAVTAAALIGGLAARDMGWVELVLLALGLALFSAVVFVYGLSQPIDLWPS
jgi:hypothetical protein